MHSETNAREDEHRQTGPEQQLPTDSRSSDSGSSMATKEYLVLLLEINYQGEYTAQTIEYVEWDQLTVGEIRRQLEVAYSLPGDPGAADVKRMSSLVSSSSSSSPPSTWLVWRGRKLRDFELAKDLGLENFSRLFLGVSQAGQEVMTASTTTPMGLPSSDRSKTNSGPFPMGEGEDPFMQLLISQPGLLLEMLQANPKMRSLMERNPQIGHALADPTTIRDLLRQQRDPTAYQEAMRGHDRALANIENVPGGFQALRQFYTDEMAEMEEGLSSLAIGGGRGPSSSLATSVATAGEARYTMKGRRTTEPMPNPWRPTANPNGRAFGTAPFGEALSPWSPPSTAPPLASTQCYQQREPTEAELTNAEGRFRNELRVLRDMGFTDRRANVKALLATGGNVNSAIERLLLDS